MTQQPFDPMDKLLREALASDALPPADLTDRIMARVAETPQHKAVPARKLKILPKGTSPHSLQPSADEREAVSTPVRD